MRYPVGKRLSLQDACDAARDAANLTKMRYHVRGIPTVVSGTTQFPSAQILEFRFEPKVTPNSELHEAWES